MSDQDGEILVLHRRIEDSGAAMSDALRSEIEKLIRLSGDKVEWVRLADLEAALLTEARAPQEPKGWYCGCGWPNGINLSTCAQCGRSPGSPDSPCTIIYSAAAKGRDTPAPKDYGVYSPDVEHDLSTNYEYNNPTKNRAGGDTPQEPPPESNGDLIQWWRKRAGEIDSAHQWRWSPHSGWGSQEQIASLHAKGRAEGLRICADELEAQEARRRR